MKTWEEAKLAYLKDHLSKPLKKPAIRINALNNIELAIKGKHPEHLISDKIFSLFSESSLRDYYQNLKGKHLNSAEKSVIHGLFKFSVDDK